jgi:hypothetical protein
LQPLTAMEDFMVRLFFLVRRGLGRRYRRITMGGGEEGGGWGGGRRKRGGGGEGGHLMILNFIYSYLLLALGAGALALH